MMRWTWIVLAAIGAVAVFSCGKNETPTEEVSPAADEIRYVRSLLSDELSGPVHLGEPNTGAWSDSDRDDLRVFLLALELHDVWGYGDDRPTHGLFTPEFVAHLESRIAEHPDAEQSVALSRLIGSLKHMEAQGIALTRPNS